MPAHRSARRTGSLALVLALLAVLAPGAAASMRSPHLESSCPSGYAYGERVFGNFVVEGCGKAKATDDRPNQWVYTGDIELNGMLVTLDGDDDLHAWTESTVAPSTAAIAPRVAAATAEAHVKRADRTKLYLDPRIGSDRRRFLLYAGALDLVTTNNATGTLEDIPVNGAAALLGLRVRSAIEDALFTEDGVSFPITLSLGALAPTQMRDVTGQAQIMVDDGAGMRVTDLEFHVARIELPGVVGMRNLRITYSASSDRWTGHVLVDLGELFGSTQFDFTIEVTASTGVPTYIRLAVSNMNFPIGQSGIVLQGLRAEFGMDPLLIGAGATATAGPQVFGNALIELSGDLEMKFEPVFRLEATGTARVLPSGDSELGNGRIVFVYDAEGYVHMEHEERYEALVLGVGPAAEIDGEGSYSTDRNLFDVEAHATGRLELGKLGGFDVIRIGAVVSSDGWGACGPLASGIFSFIQGGIGQEWDEGMDVILGCDLSKYTVDVPDPGAASTLAIAPSRTVRVPAAGVVALRVIADAPGPSFRLTAPGGSPSVDIAPAVGVQTRGAAGGPLIGWIDTAASDTAYVFLKGAPAGTYTLQWLPTGPQVTAVAVARSAAAVAATATVTRRPGAAPGVRRLAARVTSGLGAGESLLVAVRGPKGAIPVGRLAAGAVLDVDFAERGTGARTIVGQVLRDGVPLPGRVVVLGGYRATAPPRPASIRVRRAGKTRRVALLALPARSAERPDAWSYVVRTRGRVIHLRAKVGRPVVVAVRRGSRLTVAARPVVDGRVLPGVARVRTVRKV